MSGPVDVLAAMRVAEAYCYDAGASNAARNVKASRAAVADAIAANVAMLAALDEAFGINATHDDERIYDELPSSDVASAYFMARAAVARCKGGVA
jgi:hypothetical protein